MFAGIVRQSNGRPRLQLLGRTSEMMTMSKALSSGQAKDYYQKEYTSARENYYSERGDVNGQWFGRLAEEWNLQGEVQSEQYERLVAGQHPHTGEQLIRAARTKEQVNKYEEENTINEHRAGWDANFSAPKSRMTRVQKSQYNKKRMAYTMPKIY